MRYIVNMTYNKKFFNTSNTIPIELLVEADDDETAAKIAISDTINDVSYKVCGSQLKITRIHNISDKNAWNYNSDLSEQYAD